MEKLEAYVDCANCICDNSRHRSGTGRECCGSHVSRALYERVVGSGLMSAFSLGAVYNAGYLRMSTWIPVTWGLINVLVLILSSFAMQGGL